MQLTEHFSLAEFTRSATARARHIDNTLDHSDLNDSRIINNLTALCIHVLEPLRRHINEPAVQASACFPHRGGTGGGSPLIISSGYRCPRLNAAVGGAPNSQHLTGEAADIHLPSIEQGKEWFVWMMDNLEFDQLIWEHTTITQHPSPITQTWIHVSYRSCSNRQQVIHNLRKK